MATPNDIVATRTRLRLTPPQLAALLSGPSRTVHPKTVRRWEQPGALPPPYLKLALERLEQLADAGELEGVDRPARSVARARKRSAQKRASRRRVRPRK